jgi:uncharacterized protein (DUF433 family)
MANGFAREKTVRLSSDPMLSPLLPALPAVAPYRLLFVLPLSTSNFILGPRLKTTYSASMSPENYRQRITIEPGKRGGKPCIRHMRITVYDILGWLATGMSNAEIVADFPELTTEDIQAALAFAADREHHLVAATA